MAIQQLGASYKHFLQKIAAQVQSHLEQNISIDRIIQAKKSKPLRTNTLGWCVDIFGFKRTKGIGTIQLWLDLFTNQGRPTLAVTFWSSDIEIIKKLAEVQDIDFSDHHPVELIPIRSGNILEKPLARKYFDRFIIEPYNRSYLTCYFFEKISNTDIIAGPLSKKLFQTTKWLLQTIPVIFELKASSEEEYTSIENRILITTHKKRERSGILATEAKLRDNFTCQVCDFKFTDKYGELGRGIAEAHHIVSLSSAKKKVVNSVKDLITVCPNCHRVLHKMEGKADDYKKLRTLVKRLNKGQ